MLSRHSFGTERRLLNSAEYSRVFDEASCRASHRHVLLLAAPNSMGHSRLGLVIAKKNVRKAVLRNRIKRIAREVFRQQPGTDAPLDVVLLARRGIDSLDKKSLAALIERQWRKLQGMTS